MVISNIAGNNGQWHEADRLEILCLTQRVVELEEALLARDQQIQQCEKMIKDIQKQLSGLLDEFQKLLDL